MKKDNKGLLDAADFPAWELMLLALLLFTALGASFRGSLNSFPEVSAADPYDVRPERTQASSMNRVETGL